MDPYLEDPPRWGGVHTGMILHIAEFLNRVLPAGYAAEPGERLWVVRPERNIYPDVAVVEPPRLPARPSAVAAGATATVDPPWVITVERYEMREPFLNITAVNDPGRIITAVEVLSPSNKRLGSEGRNLYLKKQEEVLQSVTHLLEIDLLRAGAHTVAAPRALLAERGAWDYAVCLHRAASAGRFEVWPFTVRDRMPRVAVPLAEGEPDVVLDLQAVFDGVYDAGPYPRRVDYRRDPPLALNLADAEWVDALLRSKGMR